MHGYLYRCIYRYLYIDLFVDLSIILSIYMCTERDTCTELAWHRASVLAYLNTIYLYMCVCESMYMNACMYAVRASRVGTRHAASSRRRLYCALQSCLAAFIARCNHVSPSLSRVAVTSRRLYCALRSLLRIAPAAEHRGVPPSPGPHRPVRPATRCAAAEYSRARTPNSTTLSTHVAPSEYSRAVL
jgi:hypothetical protein